MKTAWWICHPRLLMYVPYEVGKPWLVHLAHIKPPQRLLLVISTQNNCWSAAIYFSVPSTGHHPPLTEHYLCTLQLQAFSQLFRKTRSSIRSRMWSHTHGRSDIRHKCTNKGSLSTIIPYISLPLPLLTTIILLFFFLKDENNSYFCIYTKNSLLTLTQSTGYMKQCSIVPAAAPAHKWVDRLAEGRLS